MAGIVFNQNNPEESNQENPLQSQVDNLQTTLASLNQKVFSLQEAIQQKDQEIINLKKQLYFGSVKPSSDGVESFTIVSALINLFNLLLPPRKGEIK